ncbi:tetratricopeptide repeat protein [Paenibacillus mendelii]|uniref:Tetratricopeptide repeat protein n=1 Tax=Paenibacillus mendelii TaxID=206163 RepID=A0ABV6JD75_9BACL|nr:tetratricopeptide repeat protein [Paenibacillus mendelii]MCQ6562386.1 tetratricopeptide repeat protein [Paenibacillus mendelii]
MNPTTLPFKSSYLSRIDQLLHWDRYEDALKEAEAWLKEDPDDADAYGALSVIYQFIDIDKALYWSGEALNRDPELESAWRVRLVIAYERKDWPAFETLITEMLRMFPENSYLYRMQGQYWLTKNKWQEACEQLEQAIALDHSSLNYAVYAYTLALLNKDELSLDAERTSLREDPEDDQALLYLAWAAERRNDHRKAAEFMGSAIRLDPSNAQIREEYLGILQKSFWFYRIMLFPNYLRKLKGWHILIIWIACWVLFKPLLVLFILLYIASYWASKGLVHVKVFGWTRRR